MFTLSVSPLEIFLRGTIVYLVLFALLRFAFRRIGGTISLGDVLMVALVAAAAQNAIADDHHSVLDGLILVTTIAFWNFALDWLGHRYPIVQRIYNPPPLLLIKDGQMIRGNMRRELITEDELMGQLRRIGIENVNQVKVAYMEGDGTITAIRR